MKRCYACIHPEREAIDAELVRGELSLRTIAARFSSPDHPLSATGIYRHRLEHVEEPTVGDILEPEGGPNMDSEWRRYNGKEWEEIPRPPSRDLVELRGRRPQEGYYMDYGTRRPRKRKMYRLRRTRWRPRRRPPPAPEGYAWVTDAAGNRVLMRSGW